MIRLSQSITLVLLGVLVAFTTACSNTEDEATATPAMDTLVSTEWLMQHLDDPDLVVIDATVLVTMDAHGNYESLSGRTAYTEGHIPTAVFADLKGKLRDQNNSLEFALPTPEQFAVAMGELGVGDDSRVVIYDNMGTSWAARVWWMLRWIGFDRAAVLDGGLTAWTSSGGELVAETPDVTPRNLTVRLRPEVMADQDEVRAAIDNNDALLVDALHPAHYRGEMAMYEQPGHIPGARNISVMSLFAEDGRFRAQNELDTLLDGDRSKRTITYCGGGIAASGDAFALVRAGYTDVAIYAASLEEWAANPDNPMDVVLDFDDDE